MIAMAALVLACVDFGAWVVFFLVIRRFWKQAAPTVTPLLAMMAPPPASNVGERLHVDPAHGGPFQNQ